MFFARIDGGGLTDRNGRFVKLEEGFFAKKKKMSYILQEKMWGLSNNELRLNFSAIEEGINV